MASLPLKDKELPADEVDEHVGKDETREGGPFWPVQEVDEAGLRESAAQGSRKIDCGEEQILPNRRVAAGGKDPLHVEPIHKGIGKEESDSGWGQGGFCEDPFVEVRIVEFGPDQINQSEIHAGVDDECRHAAEAVFEKLDGRRRLPAVKQPH